MQLNKTENAILLTLAYSDIFDFPLTKEELWKFLVSKEKIRREEFEEALSILSKLDLDSRHPGKRSAPRISYRSNERDSGQEARMTVKVISDKDNFYCLSGREIIIHKRKKNLAEVEKKLNIAEKAAYYLSFIPTIKFIGVSGGLAIGNVQEADDIDFFIITKKNTLFTTRFIIVIFLEFLNLRRRPDDKHAANKICVNLLVDESNLSWPTKMRDLYTAHEIIQLRSLLERNDMYEKFIKANEWVKKYFINFMLDIKDWKLDKEDKNLKIEEKILTIEPLMRKIQENYMKKHKTTEIVSRRFVAFHPKNYRTKTLLNLRSKCRNLGLLTNF